jgi:hypothetical protein
LGIPAGRQGNLIDYWCLGIGYSFSHGVDIHVVQVKIRVDFKTKNFSDRSFLKGVVWKKIGWKSK